MTRQHVRKTVGIALGIAAFIATAVLALTHNGRPGAKHPPHAPISTVGPKSDRRP